MAFIMAYKDVLGPAACSDSALVTGSFIPLTHNASGSIYGFDWFTSLYWLLVTVHAFNGEA